MVSAAGIHGLYVARAYFIIKSDGKIYLRKTGPNLLATYFQIYSILILAFDITEDLRYAI